MEQVQKEQRIVDARDVMDNMSSVRSASSLSLRSSSGDSAMGMEIWCITCVGGLK